MVLKKESATYVFALDIGSKKLTCAAAPVGRGGEIGSAMVATVPARGIFKGVVNDLAALSEAVQELFKTMEGRCQAKATTTALSISGNYIDVRHSLTAIALSEHGTRSITRRDMDRLNQQARTLGLELDEYLLHEYPQGYSIDRHNMTLNPLGLHGRKFEMDLLLVAARAGYLDNIRKAVEQAGLDIGSVVYAGAAAAEGVLSAEEMEKGAVVVDIGDALTGVLIYKDGLPRSVRVLSFGGRHLTEVLANYCKISAESAENIVRTELDVAHDVDETEEVMVKGDDGFKSFRKKELAAVVAPEIDRFVGMLRGFITESGVSGLSGAKIVVTGGLSLLEGLLEKMESDMGQSVKMGIPRQSGDIPLSQAPSYAAAIGLLLSQAQRHETFLGLKVPAESKNKISKFIDYVTNLYHDYF